MLVDLQAPKRHLNGGTFKVFSDTSNKMLNVHYIYSTQTAVRVCSTRQEGNSTSDVSLGVEEDLFW